MADGDRRATVPTSLHWGSYDVEVAGGRVVALHPSPDDPEPSPIGRSLVDAIDDAARIRQPMVRAGWLDKGPLASREGRGSEPFVPVSWDNALDLVAGELKRVAEQHGNRSIFAGSYGWASAGRFHHAQSQLKRFLNLIGGFVSARNSYSLGAAHVIMPRILGELFWVMGHQAAWDTIAEHGGMVVAFGGFALKNAQVNAGGVGRHTAETGIRRCHQAGVEFVNFSPVRDDVPAWLPAEWHATVPGTDTAVMLALAHTLVSEGLHDRAFLARYCQGYDRFEPYLMGATDGQPKSAEWAAPIAGIDAETIRSLARRMAAKRTMVMMSWSLQRADHGEQPLWMALTLAAMLGQIGLPGGGYGFGYNAVHGVGAIAGDHGWASVPQGENRVEDFIPVARIADMLLNPGATLEYNGQTLTYPDVRLIYWAGGNPFHHHQDINRLIGAWRRPETVIVHEPWWNPLARHADIVLPATTPLERNDVGMAKMDGQVIAMHQAVPPVGQARNDFDIFRGLARQMGVEAKFTEGRGEMEWLRHLYELSRQRVSRDGVEMPDFDSFWVQRRVTLPPPATPHVLLSEFRADPETHRLATPSGKIEIFSSTIDSFGYDDCPGHPVWREPKEWLGSPRAAAYPLHLVSNQPRTRLHSQLDNGAVSREAKVAGREPMRINPADAAARGIATGDVVRIFNDRGACLAGAVVSEALRPGVIELPTGAWYDPLEQGRAGSLDRHGNPNMLTRDEGCSRLSQGCSAYSTLVQVERYAGEVPPIMAFTPPPIRG